MIEIKLPFWLDGVEIGKLRDSIAQWWDLAETWIRLPLAQMDPLTCHITILNLLAYQRDISRFTGEPEDLYRKRVKFAYVNAQDAGSKAGFIRIFERLGIGYVEIEERVDPVNWDVVLLTLSNSQLAQNLTLIDRIIQKYGRTCRRYQLQIVTPVSIASPCFANGCTYYYDIAGA